MNEPRSPDVPGPPDLPGHADADAVGEVVGRRRFLVGAVGTLVVGAGAGSALAFLRDDPPTTAAGDGDVAAATTAAAVTTSSAPTTRVTLPPVDDPTFALPQPLGPPSDAYAQVAIDRIGSVSIPRIGLDHAVYEGIWLTVLDEGPGHWPGTALPGQLGNTVFPGHRVTHSHPFRRLDELAPGDEITFTTGDGSHTYEVRETLIVSPKDLWVVDQHDAREVTLVACHPPHSARQRIVVKGDLVRSVPNAAAAGAAEVIADAADGIAL